MTWKRETPHQHGGTDAPECTTCRDRQPDRPWTQFAMITAGDTLLWRRKSLRGPYRWMDREGITYTDADAKLCGPVRQAAVVTLPDLDDIPPAELGLDELGRWVFSGAPWVSNDPEYMERWAAILLAAARQERQDGGE